ncbi:MAG: RluA family pseudouridine synthase [Chromatiales bacterium]|nr:RluA family pseudouridine synthase [Chromatiales bacterium]
MPASEFHISVEHPSGNPVELLAKASGFSRQQIKQVMWKGAVWLERDGGVRRIRRAKSRLQQGDHIHLYYNEQVLAAEPPDARLVADEGEFSVWFKPKGMLSQGSKWGDHCAIDRWVQTHLTPERPVFLIHRLDRATDGLMVLAHKKRVAAELARLFRDRKIKKRYQAWVVGRYPTDEKEKVIDEPIDGRPALSRVTHLQYNQLQHRSLLQVEIETGRKHQIRRHLSGIGYPVVGDRLYSDMRFDEDLQLTCVYLEIPYGVESRPGIYRA